MPRPKLSLLSSEEIRLIHETSLQILHDTGILVHNAEVRRRLVAAGARLDAQRNIVYFDEVMVMRALESAGKKFELHGRDPQKKARFGYQENNLVVSPGQYAWFDYRSGERRQPLLADAQAAGRIADALENITLAGPMAVPADVPTAIRDVVLTAELLKCTGKPVRVYPVSRRSSYYVLEIFKTLAGGEAALRAAPMTEMFLEPISPLQLPDKEPDILLEFLALGQPVTIGPMAMASGTGPATLAGTLAQENAEILSGIVVVQTIAPGTPILYGGIPHIMDARTSICSFGSPEQGLMALACTEIGKSYGLPVYANVNLTDAKCLDLQAGAEKIGSMLQGMLAGADLLGHAGIVGTDHGGSLSWLVTDNETFNFARRIARGFDVDAEHVAASVIASVGPGGNFLAEEHTVRHIRKETWSPGALWTCASYDGWAGAGGASFEQRAVALVDKLLQEHRPAPLDPNLEREIDRIVAAARAELVR